MTKIIEVNGLKKTYKKKEVQTNALDGVELTINKGDFVSVTGSSGGGKSTLLSVLALLNPLSSGVYKFLDVDVSKISPKSISNLRCNHIGTVFQSFNLIDYLTVSENIALPMIYGGKAEKQIKERVSECISMVGLDARHNHKPDELSGGQQQRVAIARALVNNPDIVFLDEPTGNLDSKNSENVLSILQDLNKQMDTTIFMVTHENQYAELAKKKYKMIDGKLHVC